MTIPRATATGGCFVLLFFRAVVAQWPMEHLSATLANIAALQRCDIEMSISTRDRDSQHLSESILEQMTKSSYTITIEDAIDNPALIELTKKPRCLMYMFICNDPLLLQNYLRVREDHGLFNKRRKHLFVTFNPEVKDTVYSLEEFQYHAHTFVYEMNEVGCLYTEAYLTNDQLGYDQNWTIADNFNNSDFNATGAAVESATFLRQCVIRGYQFDSFNTSQPKVYFIRKVTENVPADLDASLIYPDICADMKGYNFTVAALQYFPYVWVRDGNYEGIEINIARFLANRNNFKFHIVNPPDGAWGSPDENGTWSGLIGHSKYGISNWSMAGIAVGPEREDAIDFSFHYILDYFDWVAPMPQQKEKWTAIFKPFSIPTWMFLILASVLAGPFLAFTVKHSRPDEINNVYGWPRSILYVFSVLFENPSCDTDTLPQTPAPKFFLTTWWILCLIMTVAYTGNLTSFMTNPGFEDPLDTPAKLLEKGVQLGMYNYQGSTTLAFGGSSNPEYCQIWAAKDWITSFGDSMEGTIAGDLVFMDYRWYLEGQMGTTYIDALGRPKMILAKYDMFRFGIGWSVQPRSMFLESLNQGILEASMTGHVELWKRRNYFWKKADVRAAMSPEERFFKFGSEPPIKPLYFGDLVGPFYIYLLWMGLALAVFVGESTVGCNLGATSARGRHQAERREERGKKRKLMFKLRDTKDFDRGFYLEKNGR